MYDDSPDDISDGLDKVDHLKRHYDQLANSVERKQVDRHCEEIAEVVSPRKVGFVGHRTPGDKRMRQVLDSTGIQANEMLAAGMHGMATNPASRWFSMRMVGQRVPSNPMPPGLDNLKRAAEAGDPEAAALMQQEMAGYEPGEMIDINDVPEVQKWMSDVEEIMWQRMYAPGTNITPVLHEAYLDLGAFGTAIIFVGQAVDEKLLFQDRALSECYIAENADGRVDVVYRCTEYTVRQMMQMANSDGWKVSDDVKTMAARGSFEDKVKVIHAVYPRASKDRDPDAKTALNMEFASCYFEYETSQKLEESGFPEFPYLVVRWSKYSGEVYGRSPGMVALPDIKMLQAMELTKIKLMQKAADPPLWLKDDGIVGQTRTVPGGINYWRGNPNEGVMMQPVSIQGLQALAQDQVQLRERILRVFFADLMRMAERPNMTATEVMQRTQEMLRLFGPVLGRLESEMLGPLIERVFGILNRAGLIPPPPQILEGKDFTVEYVSPIASAQKQTLANNVLQVVQLIGSFGPEVAMQVLGKKIDMDKLVDWAWALFNCDPDLLRDEEALAQMQQMEQAAMAAQTTGQIMQPMQQGASMVKDLAQAAGQVPNAAGGGFDLNQVLAQMSQEVANSPDAQRELQSMASSVAERDPSIFVNGEAA